jgi:hypothetical protein
MSFYDSYYQDSQDCDCVDRGPRIRSWLELIGKGEITIDMSALDHTAAVPIAAWLAKNIIRSRDEWPAEREERLKREARRAARKAAELEAEVQQLHARAAQIKKELGVK